tara:strand:+ start:736 stop:2061 length:1326 start_codon:yes stop_codon:yes gene_type:complete
LWVLCLAGLISLLLAIGTGVLVRQELVGSVKFGVVSKAALFLAEIPMNLKKIGQGHVFELLTSEQRFTNISGFTGEPLEEEIYLLLSKYDGDAKRSIVELVDLRSFEVKKTWRPDIDQINDLVDTSQPEFENLKRDANTKRYRIFHPFLTEDSGLIFSGISPLVKIDKNSQLVWQNQEDEFNHSIEEDHEGNLWVPSMVYPYQIDKRYTGTEYSFRDDAITKVSADGKILFQKSVSNILIENNLSGLIFNTTDPLLMKDPIHLNDIQPVLTDGPHWKRGDLFLSLRHQSMILLYRPSTNEIIWKGTDHIGLQHDVDILDDHRISIFNNNAQIFADGERVDGSNEVVIYDFKTDSYYNYLDESLKKYDVRTITNGRGHILDSGDLFIEETIYGRLLYFNKDASLQWQYVNRAIDGIFLLNWSRILYKPEDIKKVRKSLEIRS